MAPIEVIGQATKRNKIQTFIEPTIFIGLGGTGKEVLLRIRRRFFEKYGITGYPTIGYLWIDTDMQNQNLDGQELDDHIADEVRFRAEEYVDAQVPAEHFMGYFNNPRAVPHIFSWIYPQLASLGAVMNGARMIRPLGRLGFFHNFATIHQRLTDLMTQINSTLNREKTQNLYGVQVGDTPKVVLVCSIAGGTGSGMFLDCAFFCRKYFSNPAADIIGYLLLPPVFANVVENNEPLYANAYAALKELEFYSMRKDFLGSNVQTILQMQSLQPGQNQGKMVSAHDFEVDWSNSREKSPGIAGPPFNTCYLIDNRTEKRGAIGLDKKGDLCDMIAETLFADYTNHIFAANKRSVRSNLDDYLGNELKYDYLDARGNTIHTEVFSCRFSAMGFSKIFVPADRIRKACAYRFASDLAGEFLRENTLSESDPARLLKENDLPEIKLRFQDFADLQRENDSGGTFAAAISRFWKEQAVQDLKAEVQAKDPDLPQKFQNEVEDYSRSRFAEPAERAKWGVFIRRLVLENQPAFTKASTERILARVKVWLDSPRIRMSLAIRFLQELSNHLEKLATDFRQRSEAARQEEKDISQDIRLLCDYMQDERKGLWVHRRSLEALVEKACSDAADMFSAKMRAKVFDSGEQVCSAVQAYIGKEIYKKLPDGSQVVERAGLIQSVATLREQLGRVQAEIDRKLASFEKTSEHLIFENLYVPGMFREYYHLHPHDKQAEWQEVDLRGNEEQLLEEERNFRASAKIANNYDLLEQFQVVGPLNIERSFTRYAESRFQDLDVSADALKIFYEKYEKEHRVGERIARMAHNAAPWIAPSTIAACVGAVRQNYEEAVELGLSSGSSAHDRYQNFVEQLRNNLTTVLRKTKLGPPVALEPNNIALYTEMAGIPLLFVDRLNEYEQAYSVQLRNQKPLHLTRSDERYADILTKTEDQIEKTIQVNEILLVGAILHTLEVVATADNDTQYTFKNEKSVPPRTIPLGRHSMAVALLSTDPDLFGILLEKTNQVRGQLTLPSRKQFYALLASQIEDGTNRLIPEDPTSKPIPQGPFPPRYLKIGARTINHTSPEHEAITRVLAQEQERLMAQTNSSVEELNAERLTLYTDMEEFSEPVKIGKIMMRRLKNPQTRTAPPSAPPQREKQAVAVAAGGNSNPQPQPVPKPEPVRRTGPEDIL